MNVSKHAPKPSDRPAPFRRIGHALALAAALAGLSASADDAKEGPPKLLGRWDLKVHDGATEYPSWIDVHLSGYKTLVGSYVGRFGSARPIGEIRFTPATGEFSFSVPPQWERRSTDVAVHGKLEGETISGEVTGDQGQSLHWEGRRAPALVRATLPRWGRPIPLFNGRDLTGLKPRNPSAPNGWRVENGVLTNAVPGNDLLTEGVYTDFKLRAVFRYPPGSNSGLYLRGRYEVQIEDDSGEEADSHRSAGVYGHLTPRVNAARKAGEWQTLDVTLAGRVVTVVLNGDAVIERQVIPGITGGALDSDEEKPGPLMIQGDHGPVEFKTLLLTPAE